MHLNSSRHARITAILATVAVLPLGVALMPVAASASTAYGSTTPDACGYFIGDQTPAFTHTGGTTTTQRGTSTGISSNYAFTPSPAWARFKGLR